MTASIFIATQQEVVERNLQGKYVKPGLLMLTMWYMRKFMSSSDLEGVFDESQNNRFLPRSAMPGDVIHLDGKFFLITQTGFEEFTPGS